MKETLTLKIKFSSTIYKTEETTIITISNYLELEPRSLGSDLLQRHIESLVDVRNRFSKKQSPTQCLKNSQRLAKATTQTREEQGLFTG